VPDRWGFIDRHLLPDSKTLLRSIRNCKKPPIVSASDVCDPDMTCEGGDFCDGSLCDTCGDGSCNLDECTGDAGDDAGDVNCQFNDACLANAPLANPDFECGDLTGWTGSGEGSDPGLAFVIAEGTCWSYDNTRGIRLSGNFAALVRSSVAAPVDSVGVLTSSQFVAGAALAFQALSERNADANGNPNPVSFEVRILDASGTSVLTSQSIQTNIVDLPIDPGCAGSNTPDGTFSNHQVDTSQFAG
jgi:hypothetical protein